MGVSWKMARVWMFKQVMLHGDRNIGVPARMQNRSLTVSGAIRLIQEAPHFVRMMRATLDESLKDLPPGWHRHQPDFDYIGYHVSDEFMDPHAGQRLTQDDFFTH